MSHTAVVTRAAVLALLASTATGGAARPAQEKQKEPTSCCFTNQRYSGTCEVTPAAGETCASILDYLNKPMSQGKGYCGNTEIRGGWQACEVK
jgi:hypothetical protein